MTLSPTAAYGAYSARPSGAGQTAAPARSDSLTSPAAQASSANGASVVISLSDEAKAALAAAKDAGAAPPPNAYTPYFLTRDGAPASALSEAVVNPGFVGSSAGLSAADVATDARSRMDAQYAAMKESGQPFNYDSFEGKDWYSLMGDLDRRSLNAVASNSGGGFSKRETDMARTIMSQQQGLAMGLYSGPSRLAGSFVDPFMGDHAAQAKAGVTFLDAVSDDEKTSITWAFARASTQYAYESLSQRDGKAPDDLDSLSPLARVIKEALESGRDDLERSKTTGPVNTIADLKRQPWFVGFEPQLDAALGQQQQNGPSARVSILA